MENLIIKKDEVVVEPEVKVDQPPQKTETELLREKIVTAQDELNKQPEKAESKPEEEIVEDIDLDKLFDEFPDIASMVKDSKEPIKEILRRYSGGLKDFNTAREYIAELEKAGINTEDMKKELLAKLKTGQLKPDGIKSEETLKSFRDQRKDKFLEVIPKTRKNELDENVIIPEDERTALVNEADAFAERIFPSAIAETIKSTEGLSMKLFDDLSWLLFTLKPVIEQFKDKMVPSDTRKQIEDFYKSIPATRDESVRKAIQENRNFYDDLYEHFIQRTKGDKIAEEKVNKILAQREEESKKKKDAQTIESKNKVTPLTTDKPLDKTKTPQQIWG